MTSEITWPPIGYVFFEGEQTSDEAWNAIAKFAEIWNGKHENKFVVGDSNEWGIDLHKGISDPEYQVLDRELHQLKKQTGVNWFLGLVDNRKPKDFENAPYTEITGNTYPLEFIVNHESLFGPVIACAECGIVDETNRELKHTPIVDESFLQQQIHPSADYSPPGLDIITIENGLLIVSVKIKQLLSGLNARGYELLPVINSKSEKPSDNLFLLRAKKSLLKPCNFHTPVTGEGICSTCGRIIGGMLSFFYVRQEWLDDQEIFSRHRLKYGSIYMPKQIYNELNGKIKGMLPTDGIFVCSHI